MSRQFRFLGNEISRAEKEAELDRSRKYLLHWAYSGFVNKPRNDIEIARDTTDFTFSHEQIADDIHNARDRFRVLLQELNPDILLSSPTGQKFSDGDENVMVSKNVAP